MIFRELSIMNYQTITKPLISPANNIFDSKQTRTKMKITPSFVSKKGVIFHHNNARPHEA